MASLHSLLMSEAEYPVDVTSWISDVASDFSPQHTPTHTARNRKRSRSVNDSPAGSKHLRLTPRIPKRGFLAAINPNPLSRSRSVTENRRGSTESSPIIMKDPPCTPDQSATKAYQKTRISTSSSVIKDPKETENVHNVRMSLAEQGMWFENYERFEKYPGFVKKIDSLVFRERGSGMRTDSVKRIKQSRRDHATDGEGTYVATIGPLIIKDERMVLTSKRTIEGIIKEECRRFETDQLRSIRGEPWVNGVLPKRIEDFVGKILGYHTPKPDWAFGISQDKYPPAANAKLSGFVKGLISVAPGLQHAFFGIENKGAAEPIEKAENQALRTGTALVCAYRQLIKAANAPNHKEEKAGIDEETFAFTCSWVPQMAKMHVHWHELQEDGTSVWHMNVIRLYVMDNDDDMKNFRRDIYNILEWGIDDERKKKLRKMVEEIAAKTPQIICSEQLSKPPVQL